MESIAFNKEHHQYIQGMDDYINSLKQMPKEKAVAEAKKSLIRSGVLTSQGTPKKHICN